MGGQSGKRQHRFSQKGSSKIEAHEVSHNHTSLQNAMWQQSDCDRLSASIKAAHPYFAACWRAHVAVTRLCTSWTNNGGLVLSDKLRYQYSTSRGRFGWVLDKRTDPIFEDTRIEAKVWWTTDRHLCDSTTLDIRDPACSRIPAVHRKSYSFEPSDARALARWEAAVIDTAHYVLNVYARWLDAEEETSREDLWRMCVVHCLPLPDNCKRSVLDAISRAGT